MSFKQYLRDTEFVGAYLSCRRLKRWRNEGSPLPPPDSFKQLAVFYHAAANDLDILVETGTYLGDMVWAQRHMFRKIYSIELSDDLYEKARVRFGDVPNIRLIHGDSSNMLKQVIAELNSPALFWLDGHYSGGITALGDKVCPVFEELGQIFGSGYSHTVLIDDARLFGREEGYPTLSQLESFVGSQDRYRMRIDGDIIVLNEHADSQTV